MFKGHIALAEELRAEEREQGSPWGWAETAFMVKRVPCRGGVFARGSVLLVAALATSVKRLSTLPISAARRLAVVSKTLASGPFSLG